MRARRSARRDGEGVHPQGSFALHGTSCRVGSVGSLFRCVQRLASAETVAQRPVRSAKQELRSCDQSTSFALSVSLVIVIAVMLSSSCDDHRSNYYVRDSALEAFATPAADCGDIADVDFSSVSMQRFDRDIAVARIVPAVGDSHFVNTSEGRVLLIVGDSLLNLNTEPIIILHGIVDDSVLALTKQGYLVSRRLLSDLIADDNQAVALPSLGLESSIEAAVSSHDVLWVATRNRDRYALHYARTGDDRVLRYQLAKIFDQPIALSGFVDKVAYITEMESPFTVLLYSSTGGIIGRLAPPTFDVTVQAVWASLGLWPLDCGVAVQLLADLRSRSRRLVMYKFTSHGRITVGEVTTVEEPFGIVDTSPERRHMVALVDRGSSWELQHLQWSWR